MKLFGYLFVFFLFLFPLALYRFWYPSCISVLSIHRDNTRHAVPVKPTRSYFRDFSSGSNYSLISLGSGYFALYCDHEENVIDHSGVSIPSEVVIMRKNKFGRFSSVDLSDRCLFDILKKF